MFYITALLHFLYNTSLYDYITEGMTIFSLWCLAMSIWLCISLSFYHPFNFFCFFFSFFFSLSTPFHFASLFFLFVLTHFLSPSLNTYCQFLQNPFFNMKFEELSYNSKDSRQRCNPERVGAYNRTSRPSLRCLPQGCRCRWGCRSRRGRPLLHRLLTIQSRAAGVEEAGVLEVFYTGNRCIRRRAAGRGRAR